MLHDVFNMDTNEPFRFSFEKMDGYKDTADLIESCRVAILDREYTTACDLFAQGKYEEARAVFETLNGHKDSKDKINACVCQCRA